MGASFDRSWGGRGLRGRLGFLLHKGWSYCGGVGANDFLLHTCLITLHALFTRPPHAAVSCHLSLAIALVCGRRGRRARVTHPSGGHSLGLCCSPAPPPPRAQRCRRPSHLPHRRGYRLHFPQLPRAQQQQARSPHCGLQAGASPRRPAPGESWTPAEGGRRRWGGWAVGRATGSCLTQPPRAA